MSRTKTGLGFASALILTFGIPSLGSAQTCSSNADCVKGMTCQVSAVSGTSGSGNTAAPGTAPACPKGATCDVAVPAPSPPPPPPVDIMTCEPAPCQSDADCGMDMVCYSETSESCVSSGSSGSCPANTKCDLAPPTPPSCTKTTISACAYKWQLPCNADSDCGADFVCNPSVGGTCSSSGTGVSAPGATGTSSGGTTGGGGSASGAGGAAVSARPAVAPTPPDKMDGGAVTSDPTTTCTTTTSFPGYCQPKATTCKVDSDCPAVWTCVSITTEIAPAGVATPSGGAVAGPAVDGGAGTGGAVTGGAKALPPTILPAVTTMACQPPYSSGFRGTSKGSPEVTSGSAAGTPGAGTGNAGSTSSTGSGISVPPATPLAGPTDSSSSSHGTASTGNAGCAVAGSGPVAAETAVGITLLGALFGFVIARRRTLRLVRASRRVT